MLSFSFLVNGKITVFFRYCKLTIEKSKHHFALKHQLGFPKKKIWMSQLKGHFQSWRIRVLVMTDENDPLWNKKSLSYLSLYKTNQGQLCFYTEINELLFLFKIFIYFYYEPIFANNVNYHSLLVHWSKLSLRLCVDNC